MRIERKFTRPGQDVFETVEWTRRSSRILQPDGSVVFAMEDAEVPAAWSQLATDIMVSKYFRKAGVPQYDGHGRPQVDDQGRPVTGPERSARQVIHRLAGCWRHWGQRYGYFSTHEDAQAFYDEIVHMLLHQMCAPNSPQWFNTGLNWAYGMTGPTQGHWIVDPQSGKARQADDAYTHPQPHACFIQSIEDDLVNPGGIMDLWVREARLFKYGSGTGTNFSTLRAEGESLSGGGRSSGLMSFLKIGDRAAGAIKSGGTTRRAAKMVCLDLDHPDIESFVNWKVREEIKVAAMVEGLKRLGEDKKSIARELGLKLDYDFNGEAYYTVSGQNSNNSVRITNDFIKAVADDADWNLIRRIDGKVARTIKARKLWDQIASAAWHCADPGVQFDTTINQWHTCPESGRINASNPCSEYMFLDNTACNLASLNLIKFFDARSRRFDVESFEHGVRLWTVVLEISVLMAAFPSREIARLSYEYRTLGLGYANIGAMLMQSGIPYDSDESRAICGAITAIMTGRSYATSAEMAAELGAFPGYEKNRQAMLRVIRNHRRAAYGVRRSGTDAVRHELGDYEELDIRPVPIEAQWLEDDSGDSRLSDASLLIKRARKAWDDALSLGARYGYRNAQTTVIAPTGTIGLLMDCDTTGVEPDFALVKFKKLAGGGYFKIVNQSVRPALRSLGYNEEQISAIIDYVLGVQRLDVAMPPAGVSSGPGNPSTFRDFLIKKGFTEKELSRITEALPGAMELRNAFTEWTLGQAAVERLGLKEGQDALGLLGLTRAQIRSLSDHICGKGTIEGAPHLDEAHYAVFDCANKCGHGGRRFIEPAGHIRMMAAAQPFISGAISKTINLPHEATPDEIQSCYQLSWELGLKANALYRDGCKLSQPLNATADKQEADEDEDAVEAAKDEVVEAVGALARVATSEPSSGQPVTRTVQKVVERIVERPLRRRLPDTRRSLTHRFNVASHEGYITVGLYEDGQPGELFITMAKEGSTVGGLMDSLGTAISIALQYGVPVESLVNKFSHQRFEPAGMTHNREIPMAKSLVDYIFRWMGMEFVPGYREANAPTGGRKDQTPGSTKTTTTDALDQAGCDAEDCDGSSGLEAMTESTDSKPLTANGRASLVRASANGNLRGPGGSATGDPGAKGRSDRPRSAVSTSSPVVSPAAADGGAAVSTSIAKPATSAAMSSANSAMQSDAPACTVCGQITVRSGSCYKCVNCGTSAGCS
ncbi:MAG: adenosylcobalamin-dependent ribonucleoside-diphosphate reductase [Phycisphaeraceae bacterium]|nr:adenosylcobalamin-dependent ribonucleoside-diphosphate reductase [Phycisphaeraceae bacterium]